MKINRLDHVNLRTHGLDRMIAFYCDVLGFENGPRPPFGFGGAWLYCGGRAAVHLVEIDEPLHTRQPRLEHFAFEAEGLADLLARLKRHGVEHDIRVVPDWGIQQVHLADPEGNHLHIDFAADETSA